MNHAIALKMGATLALVILSLLSMFWLAEAIWMQAEITSITAETLNTPAWVLDDGHGTNYLITQDNFK